jgi:HEXXH motif-containing protein
MFTQFCSGVVDADTMAILEKSQYSHRRLALRALLDQLAANPHVVGALVDPEHVWRILAAAEEQDADAVADVLMYPTVGVWLTRALHHTRPASSSPIWGELGYLHLIAAAAAIRSGVPCTLRVPASHGAITLPTVGQARVPGSFPVGAVDVICAGSNSRLQISEDIRVDLTPASPAFTPSERYTCRSRGLVLRAWFEDRDPYRGFGAPTSPSTLADSALAEWRKLVSEAWDVLTLHHQPHARELAVGLRALVPIRPDSNVVGASSSSAFGGIGLSANGSAAELAEAMVHELQHSKLNALLGLVRLVQDEDARCYAPWRDDSRPLVGLLHGVVAFTSGVEFWLKQRDLMAESEGRGVDFDVAFRRLQVRTAVRFLLSSGKLTRVGSALVEAVSRRLLECEQASVAPELTEIVTAMVDDHRALWRLRFIRPDAAAIDSLADAWLSGTTPSVPAANDSWFLPDDQRRLPSNRRNLLRAKALEPDLCASLMSRPATLPGTTPRADAALCVGDGDGAASGYQAALHNDPYDAQAWVGLGLAMRLRRRIAATAALLGRPEVTVGAYRRVRLLGGAQPDPGEFAEWVGRAL